MAHTLQIRSLPEALHRALKVRAAQEGVSMSDWVTARIREALDRPPRDELLARIQRRSPVDVDPTALLRRERERLAAEPLADYDPEGS